MLDNIIGVEEAAKILNLSPGTVKNYCAEGKIQAKKVGKTWVIDKTKLEVSKMETRKEFRLLKTDFDSLGKVEKDFVTHVVNCSKQFNKSDFPMPHSKFTEIIFGYLSEDEQRELFGKLDFFTAVEYEVYNKFNLREDDEDNLANGTAYIIFK